jgi:hypothetical protein
VQAEVGERLDAAGADVAPSTTMLPVLGWSRQPMRLTLSFAVPRRAGQLVNSPPDRQGQVVHRRNCWIARVIW